MTVPPAFAEQTAPVHITPDQESYHLEGRFDFLTDTSGNMTLKDILQPDAQARFVHSSENPLNLGVTDKPCWIRLSLDNTGGNALPLVLELGTATINTATLFIPSKDGFLKKTTGDALPIEQRDFFHRHPNFAFTIGPDTQKTLYLRLQTNAILETSMTLHTREHFTKRLPVEYLLLGMFYAAFAVAVAYNLFLYISLRDASHLLYVLYATSFCILWLYLDGLWHQFSLPTQPVPPLTAIRLANASTCLLMVLFTAWFFNCRKHTPRLFTFLMILAAWCAINMVMVCILPLADYKTPVRLAWLAAIPAVLFTGALFMRRGFLRARYFLAAWLLVLAGAAVFMLDMYLNLMPGTLLTRSVWRIASVLEIILLSLALADRINELNRQKNHAQERALQAERLLKEQLEDVVAQRTRELEHRSQELEKANLNLEKMLQVDGLTGLFNRTYFDTSLDKEWRRMLRSQDTLCLIMADVDHFKQYNDNYGHLAGDTCLQSVARSLKSGVHRSSDVCARFGGEEFALILPSTDTDGGKVIAELIRLHIMNKHIPHTTEYGVVTVSFGVAAVVPTYDSSAQDLLKMADRALYESKKKGRNRVTVAEGK